MSLRAVGGGSLRLLGGGEGQTGLREQVGTAVVMRRGRGGVFSPLPACREEF